MKRFLPFLALLVIPLINSRAEAQQTVQICVHSTTTSSCFPVNSGYGLPVNVVAGGAGGGAVYGPTAVGVAAANPPVLLGGTANATATGNVQVLKVDSSGNGYFTNSAFGATSAATPSSALLIGVTDGTNLQPILAPIDQADGVNGNNMIANGGYVWNGASWDRMPGTAAGGVATSNSTIGATGDAACATDNGTCTTEALIKRTNQNLTTLNTTASGPIPAPTTAVAATSYGLQSAASTNATSVKASAGVLAGMNLINTTTTIYYLRMYNLAAAPTCSSATGFVRTWPIPPAAASGGAGGIAVHLPINGTAFGTGIAFCLTGGPTSTDNTNAATGVFVNLDYF